MRVTSEVWRDLGPVPGECTVCGSRGHLTMGEVHSRPSLADRLRREHVSPPTRLVTCSGCGWRWTVRSSDTPPLAVAAVVGRHGGDAAQAPAPAPAQASAQAPAGGDRRRTELPAPRSAEHALPQPSLHPGRTAATWDVLPCPRERRRLTARLR